MIREKYKQYAIEETPYVVVKADAGTYGMGVMTVKDASEITGLNRKQRNKMSVIKEGMSVSQVIIQEGVHTKERVSDGVAEPVVYMIDRYVVGGFYRVHSGPRRGREPQCAGHALRAAGFRNELLPSPTSCQNARRAAEPLLRLRCGRPPGAARRRRLNSNARRRRRKSLNRSINHEGTRRTQKKGDNLQQSFLVLLRGRRVAVVKFVNF